MRQTVLTEVVPLGCTSRQVHSKHMTVWVVCGPTVSCCPRLQVTVQFGFASHARSQFQRKLTLSVRPCPRWTRDRQPDKTVLL